MHLVCHISDPIHAMGSCDTFTANTSEQLSIGNINEAYQSTNTVNYFQKMFKNNDRYTSLDYTEETPLYNDIQDWYDIDSGKVLKLLSTSDKW